MLLVLRKLYDCYQDYFVSYSDPRSKEIILVDNPLIVVAILGFYLYFVTKGGRNFMKNRKPFQLNQIMMIYNFIQVLVNLYVGCYVLYWTYMQDYYSFKCQPLYYENDDRGRMEFRVTYWYALIKLFDLLDTIFMVLRKKNSHISFLHVYHHIGVTICSFLAAKFCPGGHPTLLGIINCFVHMVMYFYYFLTSFKPELKQSIWWKKHITQLQMVQFSILIIHFGRPLFDDACTYPRSINILILIQNLFMMVLFSDFYYKTYLKSKTKVK